MLEILHELTYQEYTQTLFVFVVYESSIINGRDSSAAPWQQVGCGFEHGASDFGRCQGCGALAVCLDP